MKEAARSMGLLVCGGFLLTVFLTPELLFSQTQLNNTFIFSPFDQFGNRDKCGYDEVLAKQLLAALGDNWGYGYDSLLVDLKRWQQSPYVTVDSLGASV